jgi:putative membrane protein
VDPTLTVLLLSWSWRVEIIATLLLAAALHLVGRWRLKRRGSRGLISPWRTAAYLAGLAIVWVALMSPIDVLSGQLFYMHMIQHLLLVMFAAPLLLLANPMPVMLWGLPDALRLEVGRWLRPGAAFRKAVRALTPPGLVWLYFVTVLVGWHDPNAYVAALRSEIVHDAEHLTFFVTAVLFWWHIIGAAPRVHRPLSRGVRIGYTVSAVLPTAITGIAIAMANEPIYVHYTEVARFGDMTVMDDQRLSGAIMWIGGGMMYLIAALIQIALVLGGEEKKEPLPASEWDAEEGLRAPGFDEPGASRSGGTQ